MNLNSQIQIHQGHDNFAIEPDWIGTIDAYREANQDTLTWGDIREMKENLEADGFHHIGGGAAGCFTICTPAFARFIAAARNGRVA